MSRVHERRSARRHLVLLVIALCAAAAAGLSTALSVDTGERPVGPLGAALVVVAVLATGVTGTADTVGGVGDGWWRAVLGAAVCTAAIGCYLARHYPYGPILGAGLGTALLVAWRAGRRGAVLAVGLLELAVLAGWALGGRAGVLVLFYLGWALTAASVGDAVHSRQRSRDERRARAELHARNERSEARRLLAEQRLEIARDLHDGVAHAMATINVQAAAAARVLSRRPEAAQSALDAIAQASKGVLDELNALVTVLRDDDRPADRQPTPGLADVCTLVAATAGNDLTCEFDLRAEPTRVAAPVGTAVYRIVQESLTNVLRHSGAARARISVVAPDGGGLVVEIRDDGDGSATPSPGTGAGIAGMRERAEATGGTLDTHRSPSGYVVRAEWGDRTA